ncbi:Uu.00g034920.m01.CDS01 [Anthostomella pinea]|uniref:Uu.00g034920.m01.CDS01 n=1 Tax=Anthostomella pinea TaxID=933095 RepID=A0AAI8YB04_9PEZI|nr:Uu.00g034920.m01.CDS01 [Anthostomella pinea]
MAAVQQNRKPPLQARSQEPSPSFYGEHEFRFNEPLHGLKWLQAMDRRKIATLKTMSFHIAAIYEDGEAAKEL